MDAIELNELGIYKIEKTKLDNYVELLFGYGHQADKYYILQYKQNKRDYGSLSRGMDLKEAQQLFTDIVSEENQLGARLDSILPSFTQKP